jgi:hypothetical protein
VQRIKEKSGGRTPILATILVGEDPASATYVKMKGNACKRVGMESVKVVMPAATTTAELLSKIDELNANPEVHGILLQHPAPKQIDERQCFERIALAKDVDGVTMLGFGRMAMGKPAYGSAAPSGIMRLLAHYKIPLSGRQRGGDRQEPDPRQARCHDAPQCERHCHDLPFADRGAGRDRAQRRHRGGRRGKARVHQGRLEARQSRAISHNPSHT